MAIRLDPIQEWRENYARRVLNIDFEPLTDAPFMASFSPIFEHLRIARSVLSPGVTFRDDELVKDGDDSYSIIISRSSKLEVTHRRRSLMLGRNDATVLHVCEPGTLGAMQPFSYVTVLIPKKELSARGTHLAEVVAKTLPRRSDGLQLLRAYINAIEQGRLSSSALARPTIQRHIIELAELACTPNANLGESSSSAISAARVEAILDCIAKRFHHPDLSVAAVAKSQRISPRYLQRLLEVTGMTFTEHVNELRLQNAFALLTQAGEGRSRIIDVALQAGFSDISHFNRLFRSRFGETPCAVRAQVHTDTMMEIATAKIAPYATQVACSPVASKQST